MDITETLPGGCRLIELPHFSDERGSLSVVEAEKAFPFPIRRVFWLYGIQNEKGRGGHAHDENTEFIIPVAGSFSIWLDDGQTRVKLLMDKPNIGVIVPPMTWSYLVDFQPETVCLVLATHPYSPPGYIYDYRDFLKRTQCE
jgi:dTDP-4-dehydrorhamnose 3,5-epimerase-like enzyme